MIIEGRFVLEDSSTSEKEEDSITSIAAGEKWARGYQLLSKILPTMKTGLVHGNGTHLIKERSRRTVLRREQLENSRIKGL
jgi:hypothetical protein